jgi:prepilin-type processing-associated H-X9-DG protein
MTLIEVFAVTVVIGFLFLMILVSTQRPHRSAHPYQCVNDLKQVGLAFRIWSGDNNDSYPAGISRTNGGAMEFATGPNVFHQFQVMSNELSTPKVLLCPQETDRNRFYATNFQMLNNSNISCFVGVDANETNPPMILSGDRNITNGFPLKNALLDLTTNRPAGWTRELHNKFGNICFADGSVQQYHNTNLPIVLVKLGVATNRLQMPILGP